MDLELSNKRALITGSNSGIGAGVAEMLAEEGASVVIHGRDADRADAVAREIKSKGGSAAFVVGDLDTDAGADKVAGDAVKAFGGIDILVNNAGGRVDRASSVAFFELPPELWNRTYNRNVTSAVRMIQRLAPDMAQRGWGRIIQCSSFSAQAATRFVSEYSSAKNALINLSLAVSKTLANTGVTVNTVSPGMVKTGALDQWLVAQAKELGFGDDTEKAVKWVLENSMQQTVNKLSTPRDIGFLVCVLCSPKGDLINGANFRIDGGAAPSIN
jgi:3-oxoacyl-[acyl-carrier protein] reductase